MKPVLFAIIAGCIFMTGFSGAVQGIEEQTKAFDYYNGIMEYYAGYCAGLGDREMEEAYLLRYPERYMANRKSEAKRQEDLALVRSQMEKGIAQINGGTHEYVVFLQAKLGEYDAARQEFNCKVLDELSCIEALPGRNNDDSVGDEGREIIARGLLFNKISMIRLFFADAGAYAGLKLPADKAKRLLRRRTAKDGTVDDAVYAVLHVRILPEKTAVRRGRLEDIRKAAATRGMMNSYVMLAEIEDIEIYDDARCSNRLGTVGKTSFTRELQ